MSKPVQLPSGAWRIRYLNADGVRESRTFSTNALARSELRRLEVGVEDTVARRDRFGSEEMTVAEAWKAYQVTRKRDANTTERRHVRMMKRATQHYTTHIAPHLADRKLADLTPRALREWVAILAEKPTARPKEVNAAKRTLSAGTIRSIVVTLRQIAKSSDVLLQVLLAAPLRQKKRRGRPRALQCIEDVRALVAACARATPRSPDGTPRDLPPRERWFQVAAAISCYCGARLGEVASLRWRHIGADTITIALSWEGPLKARYEDEGEAAARTVPLAPELAAILAAWRAVTGGQDDDRVVVVPDGDRGVRPLREHHDDMALKTRAACKRAGLTPITFHSLRASYATLVADQGLPVGKLASLLGHADIATTAIYIRPESAHAASDPRARLGGASVRLN